MKKCGRCHKFLSDDNFEQNGKIHKTCNKCTEYHKIYNKDYGKIYRIKNKEQIYNKNNALYVKTVNEAPYVRNFYGSKHRSKSQNLDFNISIDYLKQIYPQNNMCPCFNVPMIHNTIYTPTLDRINPNMGYVCGNVQFISNRANILKNNANADEINKIINYIINFNNSIVTNTEYYSNIDKYITRRIIEIKSRSKIKNIEFDLCGEYIMIPKICPALGTEIKIQHIRNDPNLPSFDRVNPKIGYIPTNVKIISRRANSIKGDGT